MSGRYDFSVTPASTYARAARLIAALECPGLVIDLGAGVGALGDAVASLGFGYLGFDADPASVDAIVERGHHGGTIDLTRHDIADEVMRRLDDIDDLVGQPVVAVTLLDVVEHLPEPDTLLSQVVDLADRLGDRSGESPQIVLSIPNVTHVDLVGKLAAGRWDVTEVGLLDSTHISLFSEERLEGVIHAAGLTEVARSDVVRVADDQRDVLDLPTQGETLTGQHLRTLREQSGPGADTYQFVRAYRRSDAQPGTDERDAPADGAPFLTVVVRTQGERPMLVDTLTSLAAQRDDDIEVLVTVHREEPEVVAAVDDLVRSFDPGFASRARVLHVQGGGRSRPLNAALDAARGRYFAILDDDDIVTSDWVAAFRRAAARAPGRMVRARSVVQWIDRSDGPVGFETVSGFEEAYPPRFDFVDAVRSNRSPPCTYAVPMGTVRALGLRFDETLRVCEDWKFEMEVARAAGAVDDDAITSVYRRWAGDGGSAAAETTQVWIEDHERVLADLDGAPTLLPPGSLTRIHRVYEYVEQLERELGRRGDGDLPYRPD